MLQMTFLTSNSVQFSCSVISDSWGTHGLLDTRPPFPSPTPGACPNSCPFNQWYHPTISSSVIYFSSHLQSFPASGSFQMSQLFASGGPSIGASPSALVLPVDIQNWSPLGETGCISLLLASQESSATLQFKSINSSALSFLHSPTLISIYLTTGNTIALIRQTFVGKVMSLLLNMLSRLVITFLPRSKRLLISWLQSPSVVIWSPEK